MPPLSLTGASDRFSGATLGGEISDSAALPARRLLNIFITSALSFLLMAYPSAALTLFFFILHSINNGIQYPILKDYFQQHIPSDIRATVLSTQNFVDSLLGIILFPVFGFIVDQFSIRNGLISLGLFVLVFGSILFIFRPLNNKNNMIKNAPTL